MSLQDELKETSTTDKCKRLMTFFTEKSFDQIGDGFSLVKDINVDRKYFLENISAALKQHFGIDSDADKIREIKTLGELVSFLDSFLLIKGVLRRKAALAALHKSQ